MRLTRSVPGKGLDIQIGFLFISSVTGYALAYSLASDPQGWAVFIRAEGAKVVVDGAEYNIFYGKKLLDGIANTDCAPYRNFQINADITTTTGSQKNNPKDFITGFLTFLSSLFSF